MPAPNMLIGFSINGVTSGLANDPKVIVTKLSNIIPIPIVESIQPIPVTSLINGVTANRSIRTP
jgi:hypothetical protein